MDFDFMKAMTEAQEEPEVQEPDLSEEEELGEEQNPPTADAAPLPLDKGDEEQEDPEPQSQQQEQSLDQRAGYAAARRKAETEFQQRLQAADAFRARVDAMAKARGFASFEDLEKAVNAEAETAKAAAYKEKYGFDPGAVKPIVEEAVNNHPAVRAARQAEAQAKLAAGRKALDDAVAEIAQMDDRIKTFDDLSKMDNYEQFDDLVRNRGYRMVDAYKLCNMDRLQAKRAAAVKQETMNSINGRKHLKQTNGGAGDAPVVVPADIKAMYKQFNPNASDAEITAHWQKSLKE